VGDSELSDIADSDLAERETTYRPPPPTEFGDAKKIQRQRRGYVTMRLAEINERIREFEAEREQITTSLKASTDVKSEKVRKLRERREYTVVCIGRLREEKQALNLEKKSFAQAPRPAPPAGGPIRAESVMEA